MNLIRSGTGARRGHLARAGVFLSAWFLVGLVGGFATMAQNTTSKIPPSASQGSITPSGKFNPAPSARPHKGQPSQSPAEAEAALKKSLKVEQLGSNTFRIGQVEFDKETRTVSVPAKVAVRTQVVEYALVTARGKTYESVFSTETKAADLHLACLLLGIEPVAVGGEFNTRAPVAASNSVQIEVGWQAKGQPTNFSLSDLISLVPNYQTNAARPMKVDKWLYNGSLFDPAGFAAQREGSLISLIRDPAALVNNPGDDRDNDQIHYPNGTLLPETGEPVRITLRLRERPPVRTEPVPPWVSPLTPLSTNYPPRQP